jgi:hypothetical protein
LPKRGSDALCKAANSGDPSTLGIHLFALSRRSASFTRGYVWPELPHRNLYQPHGLERADKRRCDRRHCDFHLLVGHQFQPTFLPSRFATMTSCN